ncbi:benzoate/H(+) symporter BenE family transporter [Modestobacter sp. SYSU DS0875]
MIAGPSGTTMAGLVTALVGFLSSFAVVLAGLRAVGASPAQAASGVLVLALTMGLGTVLLVQRTRMPITLAWSTPGAALLVAADTHQWADAVGAFLAVGLLILLTAAWPQLGSALAAIPAPLAQAMLAGVLVPLCLEPVRAATSIPWLVAPVIAGWAVLGRLAPRWAVPGAFAITLGIVGWQTVRDGRLAVEDLVPAAIWTTPHVDASALIELTVPLFLVTMASQNLPGVAVLASFGFRTPWRAVMAVTGAGTVLGAPFGGHAINLAAISAALAAGPGADPDPSRRYRAARTAGLAYVAMALISTGAAALVAIAPEGLVAAAAGLALWPVLASALAGALEESQMRLPVIATFLTAVSGTTVAGVGPAFWALAVGVALWLWHRRPDVPAVVPGRAATE